MNFSVIRFGSSCRRLQPLDLHSPYLRQFRQGTVLLFVFAISVVHRAGVAYVLRRQQQPPFR